MDYQTIASLYLSPLTEPIPTPPVTSTPARRLRDSLEPIATQGWWSRQSADRTVALGLGFFDGYVWGRAASLGQPAASVVVAAFGVFEPAFLSSVYEQGRSAAVRDDVLRERALGAEESLVAILGSSHAASAGEVADTILAATDRLDGAARPLFSGLRELAVPPNNYGRLWRAAELVREHRGDGHLAACIAAGLDAVTMNVLTELWVGYPVGGYSSSRGFTPEVINNSIGALEARGWVGGGALTPDGVRARTDIEDATDASQSALIALLGDDLHRVVAAAAPMSHAVLDAHAFPPDPRKRAAG